MTNDIDDADGRVAELRAGPLGVGAPEDDARVAALAHFALEAPRLLHGREAPQRALQEIFDLLEHGWRDDSR